MPLVWQRDHRLQPFMAQRRGRNRGIKACGGVLQNDHRTDQSQWFRQRLSKECPGIRPLRGHRELLGPSGEFWRSPLRRRNDTAGGEPAGVLRANREIHHGKDYPTDAGAGGEHRRKDKLRADYTEVPAHTQAVPAVRTGERYTGILHREHLRQRQWTQGRS